jgi:hypothetical protein
LVSECVGIGVSFARDVARVAPKIKRATCHGLCNCGFGG